MVTVRIDQGYQSDLLKQISENFDEFNIKEQRPTQLILQILKVQSLKVRHIFFEIFGQRNPLKTQSLLVGSFWNFQKDEKRRKNSRLQYFSNHPR